MDVVIAFSPEAAALDVFDDALRLVSVACGGIEGDVTDGVAFFA